MRIFVSNFVHFNGFPRILWEFSMKFKKLNRKLVSNGYEKGRFSKNLCEKIRFRWNKERKMALWTHLISSTATKKLAILWTKIHFTISWNKLSHFEKSQNLQIYSRNYACSQKKNRIKLKRIFTILYILICQKSQWKKVVVVQITFQLSRTEHK